MIIGCWSFPLLHLHETSCRKGDGTSFDEGHQCHGPVGDHRGHVKMLSWSCRPIPGGKDGE